MVSKHFLPHPCEREVMAQDEVSFSPSDLYDTFYNDLFVLKATTTIDGQPAEIDFSKKDELSLRCRSPELSLCFREVYAQLGALLRKYGVCQVNSVWCGAEPFIHVSISMSVSTSTLPVDLAVGALSQ